MKKYTVVFIICLMFSIFAFGQVENIKLNGYVQADFELSGKDGSTYLTPGYSVERDGNSDYYFRYGVYRGLLRATFESGKGSGALEVNVTEAGVIPMVAYLQFDPYEWISFQAGLLNIDYGFELMCPSSFFETIERSAFTRLLFPKEHDLGFKFTFSYPFKDKRNNLSLTLGMASGNGINKIADKHMNFLSHLKYDYKGDIFSFGVGASYYEGLTNNASDTIFRVKDHTWQWENTLPNKKNARRYMNFELQIGYESLLGLSTLRGETTFGLQPSRANNFASQDCNSYNPNDAFAYQRHFWGYTFCFIQKFDKLPPLSFVAKYSYFDKNTQLSANEVENITDLCMQNFGFGAIWEFNSHIKAYLFYDMYHNETNENFKQFNDNVLHLRLQYKF
ncbi:MAG: hypothetical protein Q4Q06_00915 [Bacteroidota bacterium]|nr:hypothetical protein [Bacteroidota bacterium]